MDIQSPQLRSSVFSSCQSLLALRALTMLADDHGLAEFWWECAVHTLFDDTTITTDYGDYVGLALRDQREGEALARLGKEIESVSRIVGWDAPVARWVQCEEWKKVEAMSAAAARALTV